MSTINGSREAATSGDLPLQFATFFVGNMFFGIEVMKVQEILRYQEMTIVPLAPSVIEGLMNLRGEIVTAIDMRRRLALPLRPPTLTPMNMVIRSDRGPVSLLVDEVGEVLEVLGDSCEPVPNNLSRDYRDLIQGFYKLESRLLLALDADRVLNVSHTN